MAHKQRRATVGIDKVMKRMSTDFMSKRVNHNCNTVEAAVSAAAGETPTATAETLRHIYVHIPFCARICPYCAFYKELLDRSKTQRFCQAIVGELNQYVQGRATSKSPRWTGDRRSLEALPSTIYFGGGTPTALTIPQLEFVLGGFHQQLDLSQLVEWTLEANPGSVSAGKADLLKRFGVNRISLGVQSWDERLLKLLGREHDGQQAEQSFQILRAAGFSNINVDLMFGLPGQTLEQWRRTLEKTISLRPEHISTYCLTYEEDTEFFLRQSRGEFRADSDVEAEFFEMAMLILEAAGYEHYEISNYARPNFQSAHNRAYWKGEDYLGIGPSAFSTVGMCRWQNIPDYRQYIDRVLSDQSPIGSTENLTPKMKRSEQIALSLRTFDGVSIALVQDQYAAAREFISLGLLRQADGNFVLTPAGKCVADSIAEAFL
jgi:oxygen-independent coproporphyrinogen-3 oxidase